MSTLVELYNVAFDAIRPLWEAFGQRGYVTSRIQDAEGEVILKVMMKLPPDYQGDPEAALRQFHEGWWFDNCHRANGSLVFDYEVTAPQV
jgi:hypothetical protein